MFTAKKPALLSGDNGFSVIEIMLGAGIVAVVALGVTRLTSQNKNLEETENRRSMAQQSVEVIARHAVTQASFRQIGSSVRFLDIDNQTVCTQTDDGACTALYAGVLLQLSDGTATIRTFCGAPLIQAAGVRFNGDCATCPVGRVPYVRVDVTGSKAYQRIYPENSNKTILASRACFRGGSNLVVSATSAYKRTGGAVREVAKSKAIGFTNAAGVQLLK